MFGNASLKRGESSHGSSFRKRSDIWQVAPPQHSMDNSCGVSGRCRGDLQQRGGSHLVVSRDWQRRGTSSRNADRGRISHHREKPSGAKGIRALLEVPGGGGVEMSICGSLSRGWTVDGRGPWAD